MRTTEIGGSTVPRSSASQTRSQRLRAERATGRKAGGSTATGLWAALTIAAEMADAGRAGSVVAMICDPGDRYLDKYYSDSWLAEQGLNVAPYVHALDRLLEGR